MDGVYVEGKDEGKVTYEPDETLFGFRRLVDFIRDIWSYLVKVASIKKKYSHFRVLFLFLFRNGLCCIQRPVRITQVDSGCHIS